MGSKVRSSIRIFHLHGLAAYGLFFASCVWFCLEPFDVEGKTEIRFGGRDVHVKQDMH
jgi:hypothetical protein